MRDVSAALQAHLELPETTTCRLLKITLKSADVFGLTTLNTDITYDGVVYSSTNGFDPSSISTNIGLSVDNSEGSALVSADVSGITEEMVKAGALDDAEWEVMLVNWADLTMGHLTIDAGDIGEVRLVDGVVFMPELLSYTMRLRQPIGSVWSVNCRATFGTAADSQTGCGVDTSAMWTSGTVTSIDAVAAEQYRIFSDSAFGALDVIPGRVMWLTGDNASSRLYQVDDYDDSTGTITLMEPTPYIITVTDTFKIRADCDKLPATCTTYSNFVNFKGEPLIPIAEGTETMTPGSQI